MENLHLTFHEFTAAVPLLFAKAKKQNLQQYNSKSQIFIFLQDEKLKEERRRKISYSNV